MQLDHTTIALFGLIVWTLALLLTMGTLRTVLTLFKGREANSFTPTGEDMSPLGKRLTRAHANCYELIPFALAVLLYAIATDQTAVTNGLALFLLFARIGQSLVHIASTKNMAVLARFALFLPQVLIVLYWSAKFTILQG